MKGVIVIQQIIECFPYRLPANHTVRDDVKSFLDLPGGYEAMLNDMFDNENDPESGWSKSGWYCRACTKEFIRERVYSWLVRQKVKRAYLLTVYVYVKSYWSSL